MKPIKPFALFLILLNLCGIFFLVWFAIPYLTHDTFVPNPDSMLPMTRWDGAGMELTLGLFPMGLANTLAYLFLAPEKPRRLRLLFFLPVLTELALVCSYWIVSLR